MTEQETRGKIFNIIREFNVKKRRYSTHTEPNDDDELADALIAAGIGDVSELKKHRVVVEKSLIPEDGNSYVLPNRPLRITQLYSGEEVEQIVKERDEYKHRAQVAERAARDLIAYYCGYTIQSDIDSSLRVALQQAEKELAEENKE